MAAIARGRLARHPHRKMEIGLLTLGIVVLGTLLVSGLCSLLEAILLSLTPSQIARVSEKRPRIGAIWQRFKANIQQPIGVILLINTTAHTMGASIAGAEFDALYGAEYVAAFSLVFTFVMLQFTEILPKTLGVRYNQRLAPAVARPLATLVTAFGPVLRVVHWINRPFEGRAPRAGSGATTVEEIASLAGMARLSKQIGHHEERIIRSASRLRELSARDVMIPVSQVAFLSSDQSLQDAFLAAHLEAHTRFPICEGGDPDAVLGFVNFKELVYSLHVNPSTPGAPGHHPARAVRVAGRLRLGAHQDVRGRARPHGHRARGRPHAGAGDARGSGRGAAR
jgi:putative hemolysin